MSKTININKLQKALSINININKLQKKYDKAVKDNLYSFTYDGAEILTAYAKYLLEYLKNGAK